MIHNHTLYLNNADDKPSALSFFFLLFLLTVLTLFYELADSNAKARLTALQNQLEQSPQVMSARLLESLEQAGLYLLIIEAHSQPEVALAGARVWVFREVAGRT
jgi:hypothetical protein